jgi:hypothetical protein
MDEAHTLGVLQALVVLRERVGTWRSADETFRTIVDRVLGPGASSKIGGRHAALDDDGAFAPNKFLEACSKHLNVEEWLVWIDST